MGRISCFVKKLAILVALIIFCFGPVAKANDGRAKPEVAASGRGSGSLVLVDNHKPQAVIVLADKPNRGAQMAASVMQDVVQQMTEAKLPILSENRFQGDSVGILVGPSHVAEKMGIKIKQDRDLGDRYVIRSGKDYIALVGNDDGELRGSVYAVYDLLQRLGGGWFGPDKLWQVIPKVSSLSVPPIQLDEKPDFEHRHIWMVKDQTMRDAWRLGGRTVAHGHTLARLVPPEKYKKEHPDWFGKEQPCLTHPEVIRHIAGQFRRKLDQQKQVVSFSLCANDTGGFCECNRCRAVGNISSRKLHLANAVSHELAQTHLGRYLLTFYAYWHSHGPPNPPLKAEPGVCVMMVNEGNHVQPWDKPEPPEIARTTSRNNTREITAFVGWKKTGAIMAIYEWWIPGCGNEDWRSAPWYSGETALRNLRYWKGHGVRFISYETGYENGDGFPLRWPLYYVGARGLWNSNLTAEQIMAEACEKLYGTAGEKMLRFYQVIEKAMADSKLMGGNWHMPSPERIYTPEIVKNASQYLSAAPTATADKSALARIQQEQQMWDKAKRMMAQLRATAK